MSCWLRNHEWGWPRKRGGVDTQVCVKCGVERDSRIQFRRVDQDPIEHYGVVAALPTRVRNDAPGAARLTPL